MLPCLFSVNLKNNFYINIPAVAYGPKGLEVNVLISSHKYDPRKSSGRENVLVVLDMGDHLRSSSDVSDFD